MEPREQAEELLEELGLLRRELADLEAQAESELAAVREKYAAMLYIYKTDISEKEKALKALMKAYDPDLFGGRDKVSLPHGLLLRSEGYKVRIPRNALARIEAQGWTEAVKVVKSLDRDVVAKWPDSRLAVIGAERKRVVSYDYEVKECNKKCDKIREDYEQTHKDRAGYRDR